MLAMKKILISALFLSITIIAHAQDKHFSQFYSAPLSINPAMTSLFEGKYRGIVNYRTQWNSILQQPFTTIGASVEGSFSPFKRGKYPDKFGFGVMFFSDDVGTQSFSTDQISLSGSYHKSLDYKGTHYISAGYQMSIVQRSINFNQLNFNDQFNGLNGYSIATNEVLPTNNITYGDMSAGIFWSMVANDKVSVYAGGAVHHFNVPDASFYENPDIAPDRIFLKTTIQGGARFRFSKKYDLEPRFIVFLQGPHIEANIGANVRIALDDYATHNLLLGGWVRPVSDVEGGVVLDAVVAMAAYRYENVQVGMSYDINTSGLAAVTKGRGGFELSMSFIGFYENDNILCPQF
jgi:type IX secretion system PorP/SprF family membrane protein